MIDLIKRFFEKNTEGNDQRKHQGSTHDVRIAACALFLEISNIDGEFSEAEKESILSILKRDFSLSDEYALALVKAADEELKGSIDLWRFTNLINKNYSIDEKVRLIEIVWKIAYMDGRLDKHEDYLVHKLSRLLRLTHKQMIDAKLRANPVSNPPSYQ